MTALRSIVCAMACTASLAAQATNNKITLTCLMSPGAIETGQTSSVLLVCMNTNTSSTQQIQPNDAFSFQFSLGDGQISSLVPSVIVNSSSLNAPDFSVTLAGTALVVNYSGAAKPFAPGDTFAVEFSLIPPSKAGSAKITLQFPSSASYNPPTSGLFTLPVTDFPLAPPGPQGPPGPQPPFIPQGPQGPVGAIGPQGPDGATGPRGPAGPQGPQGFAGFDGGIGPIGPRGATGAIGPPGAQGPPGVQGVQGTQGTQGPTGDQGPQGTPGISSTIGMNQVSFTATNASVNSSGKNQQHVSPGATFTVSFDWTINRGSFCPGCFQQFVGGVVNFDTTVVSGSMTANSCLSEAGPGPFGGNQTFTFTAPTTFGTYYIGLYSVLDFDCSANGPPITGALNIPRANLGQNTFIAAITVY
jgi:Collagen triple helix repeat (20 copies)